MKPGLYGAALLALVAMLPGLPYSYFMLVRVAVCAAGCVLANIGQNRFLWWNVAMAVLFNPVLRVHLTRELWWILDGVAAVWIIYQTRTLARR